MSRFCLTTDKLIFRFYIYEYPHCSDNVSRLLKRNTNTKEVPRERSSFFSSKFFMASVPNFISLRFYVYAAAYKYLLLFALEFRSFIAILLDTHLIGFRIAHGQDHNINFTFQWRIFAFTFVFMLYTCVRIL